MWWCDLSTATDLEGIVQAVAAALGVPVSAVPTTAEQVTRIGDAMALSENVVIVLDNFDNLQASWVTQGPKIGQLSLLVGCNDMGSLMMEENVVSAAGTTFEMKIHELRELITTTGFTPVQRDYYYNWLEQPIAAGA